MDEYEHLIAREGKPYAPMHQAMYKTIAELLRDKPANILEIGSGIGYGIQVLLDANAINSYEGIEPTRECCDYIKRTINSPYVHMRNEDFFEIDLTTLNRTSYDFTLCIEVIEHLNNELEVLTLLDELHSRTDKALFLSTPKAETDEHGKFYGKEISEMLTFAGFKFVEIEWQLPHTLYICQK